MRVILFLAALMFTSSVQADIRCALLDGNDELLKFGEFEKEQCPPELRGKGWRWVEAPRTEYPVVDDTKEVDPPTYSLTDGKLIESFPVRDKTAEQIATEEQRKIDARFGSVDIFVFKKLCDHESRIRVLEGKGEIDFATCRGAIIDAMKKE